MCKKCTCLDSANAPPLTSALAKFMEIEEHIKSNPELYFGPSGPSPIIIASMISQGALILGATKTSIEIYNNWFYIFADIDWLYKGKFPENKAEKIWALPWPFPEAGQNTPRFEVMTQVYSSSAYTLTTESLDIIKGRFSEEQKKKAEKLLGKWQRVIAFEFSHG